MNYQDALLKLDLLAQRVAERQAMEHTLNQVKTSIRDVEKDIRALLAELKDHFEPPVNGPIEIVDLPSAAPEVREVGPVSDRDRILDVLHKEGRPMSTSEITDKARIAIGRGLTGPQFASLSRMNLIQKTRDNKWALTKH